MEFFEHLMTGPRFDLAKNAISAATHNGGGPLNRVSCSVRRRRAGH